MALYILEYDLRKKRDYQKLYEELASFKAVRILESTWCFNRLGTTPVRLRDYFKSFIDSDDGLLIVEASNWATLMTTGNPNQLN